MPRELLPATCGGTLIEHSYGVSECRQFALLDSCVVSFSDCVVCSC